MRERGEVRRHGEHALEQRRVDRHGPMASLGQDVGHGLPDLAGGGHEQEGVEGRLQRDRVLRAGAALGLVDAPA